MLSAISRIRLIFGAGAGARRVSVKGEVYFEVAKDASRPFLVDVDGHEEVEVLGTAFNVNDYADEPATVTTLLSGGIRVRAGADSLNLRPGEQAVWVAGKGLSFRFQAGNDSVTAWKDGFFCFGHAPIESIMRQVSRWYKVEVVYAGPRLEKRFNGRIAEFTAVIESVAGFGDDGEFDICDTWQEGDCEAGVRGMTSARIAIP